MADPLTIVATVFGIVGTGIAIHGQLWPRPPPAPPAPRASELPAPKCECAAEMAALRRDVDELKRRDERDQQAREAMGTTLTRIQTILEERARRAQGAK